MHAICTLRFNAAIDREIPYYRLKESYRDVHGHVHSLILLNIGFEPSLMPRQVHRIADFLSERFANRHMPSLFKERTDDLTDIEYTWAEEFWQRMVNEGHIDRFERKEGKAREEARRYVDLDTVEHTDARNVGAEWLCKQAIDRLGLGEFLRRKGWKEETIHAALSHLIVRTVYAPSEWATHRIMRDNSAACELCSSKEKRSDCRLLVMALCINAEGFIRYSSILEGNAADPASLPDMVRTLALKSGNTGRAIERYPSIARFYHIDYVRDEQHPAQMKEVRCTLKDLTGMQCGTGVYFLRTNMTDMNGRKAWDYYNLIREIEATNRQLKTDLNLRRIYHRKDSRSDAHLFFGLLANWVVNTIRHQLKLTGETAYWTEIVRRMEPQKLVTTQAVNALGQRITFRACCRPMKEAQAIYQALGMKPAPFIRVKICSTLEPPG